MSECTHERRILNDDTWIETCRDCGAWRMADEVLPMGRWRPRLPDIDPDDHAEYMSIEPTP